MAGGIPLPCHLLEDKENEPRIPATALCAISFKTIPAASSKSNTPEAQELREVPRRAQRLLSGSSWQQLAPQRLQPAESRYGVALPRTEFPPKPLQLEINLNPTVQHSIPLPKRFMTMHVPAIHITAQSVRCIILLTFTKFMN